LASPPPLVLASLRPVLGVTVDRGETATGLGEASYSAHLRIVRGLRSIDTLMLCGFAESQPRYRRPFRADGPISQKPLVMSDLRIKRDGVMATNRSSAAIPAHDL
jgi:hypothetical protein